MTSHHHRHHMAQRPTGIAALPASSQECWPSLSLASSLPRQGHSQTKQNKKSVHDTYCALHVAEPSTSGARCSPGAHEHGNNTTAAPHQLQHAIPNKKLSDNSRSGAHRAPPCSSVVCCDTCGSDTAPEPRSKPPGLRPRRAAGAPQQVPPAPSSLPPPPRERDAEGGGGRV